MGFTDAASSSDISSSSEDGGRPLFPDVDTSCSLTRSVSGSVTKAYAPGRICLLGDKSDLMNRPVIAAAITKFVRFDIRDSSDRKIYCEHADLKLSFERDVDCPTLAEKDDFFKFFHTICWRFRDRIPPIHVTTYGDLPVGAGLSSSAACSVGLIRGINERYGLGLSSQDIAEEAYQVERGDLKIMCGRMDQYSVAFGGVTFIETGDETRVTPIKMATIPFVIGNSCETRRAKDVLNVTMERLQAKDPEFIQCFKEIDENVMDGKRAIRKGDFRKLGECMDRHQGIERRMGASTPKIDKMIAAAKAVGAWGAKQVGAGGGGCCIALTPEEGLADKVIEAMQEAGGRAWPAMLFTYEAPRITGGD